MRLEDIDFGTVHDFQTSLKQSHLHADSPMWEEVYRKAFPTFEGMVCVHNDGYAQRLGIDRVIICRNGKRYDIDEKVREKDWPDILLEYWSDEARKKPGWIEKDLWCDYINVAFVPSKTCHLYPFPGLRAAWLKNKQRWIERGPHIRAQNRGYTTVSTAVPIAELDKAVMEAMKIKWA
jgi:hypothetical protein